MQCVLRKKCTKIVFHFTMPPLVLVLILFCSLITTTHSFHIKYSRIPSVSLLRSSVSGNEFADDQQALTLLERASTVFGQNKYAIGGDSIYDAIRYLEKKVPEKR